MDGVAELLGHGDGELQVLGVQRLVRVGAVEVDEAETRPPWITGAQIRLVAPSSDRLSRLRRWRSRATSSARMASRPASTSLLTYSETRV